MNYARRPLILLFAFLASALPARATDFVVPEQHVVGAEEPIALGELVSLELSAVKDKPEHLQSTSVSWKVLDGGAEKRVKEYQGGVFFGAGIVPKRLNAFAAVTYLYVVRDGDKINEVGTRTVFLAAVVTVGNPGPTPPPGPAPGPNPPPGPGPTPPPAPDLPDGRYKLAAVTYAESVRLVSPGPGRAKTARALAASLQGVASAIAAGALLQPGDILQKTAEANRTAVTASGGNLGDWKLVFVGLQDRLYDLYQSKQLRSAADFQAALAELAAGFAKVPE